jgi:hypothetical protein
VSVSAIIATLRQKRVKSDHLAGAQFDPLEPSMPSPGRDHPGPASPAFAGVNRCLPAS